MATIEQQMTEIYVYVDDYIKARPELANWRSSPNDHPAFSDAEVITVGLMQSCFGCATLKKTYDLIDQNHRDAFPNLPSYQQWIARLHAVSEVIGRLIASCCLLGQLRLY